MGLGILEAILIVAVVIGSLFAVLGILMFARRRALVVSVVACAAGVVFAWGFARTASHVRVAVPVEEVLDHEFRTNDAVDAFLARSKDYKPRKRLVLAEITSEQEFPWGGSGGSVRGVIPPSTDGDIADPPEDAAASQPDRTNYPAWVQSPPPEVDGKLALVLVTDPFDNRFSCDDDMRHLMRVAVGAYAKQIANDRGIPLARDVEIDDDDLETLVYDRFYALRPTSMGEMTQLYQLTVFPDGVRERLVQRVEQSVIQRRVSAAGVLSGTVLAGLAGLCGLFRFGARNAPDPLAG